MKKGIIFLSLVLALGVGTFYLANAADENKNKTEKTDSKVVKPEAGKEKTEKAENLYEDMELFADVFALVKENYVEEPKNKDLIYGALKGMLSSLDDHSQFLDPDAYKELQVDTKGEFGGLGIEIAIREGLLTIISPIEDTPAWKAGILAGDRIVKIDGELTKDISLLDAVKKMRGEPGTKVTITILREDDVQGLVVKDIEITRAIIKVQDVKDVRVLPEKIGYIRLVEFREKTPIQLEKSLKELEQQGADSLILDLRNNPGGLLDVAVKVAEKFIEPGKLVVSTKGRFPDQDLTFKSRDNKPILNWPIVVLVNSGSASASEIVAGCLQDYHRAVILGVKSFGKGSVQTVVPLRDNSGLRLTTSKYYTPSGRCIHGIGITPDVEVKAGKIEVKEDKEDIFEQIKEKKVEPVVENKDKTQPESKPEIKSEEEKLREERFKTDNQLIRAMDLIKGIRIYQQMNK